MVEWRITRSNYFEYFEKMEVFSIPILIAHFCKLSYISTNRLKFKADDGSWSSMLLWTLIGYVILNFLQIWSVKVLRSERSIMCLAGIIPSEILISISTRKLYFIFYSLFSYVSVLKIEFFLESFDQRTLESGLMKWHHC